MCHWRTWQQIFCRKTFRYYLESQLITYRECMKNIIFLIALIFVGYSVVESNPNLLNGTISESSANDHVLSNAYENQQSDIQVTGSGVVIRNLEDDLIGSRHQKFIVRLSSGQTLLISHNIDLAPRINSLYEGDRIEFHGEYEWNAKGGVVHWTHHDPAGRHADGWIKHDGTIYQ